MGVGSDQLGDCVRERGIGVDVEDGEGITTALDTPFREDYADEMHARGLEEGEGGGVGQVSYVGCRDVANYVKGIVDHGDGGQPFVGHEEESV